MALKQVALSADLGSSSSAEEDTTRSKAVDFTEDEIHYIETEVTPVVSGDPLMPADTDEDAAADERAASGGRLTQVTSTSPMHTPRDLKMLERFGGKIDTALEARKIVMKRRRSNSESPQGVGRSANRIDPTDPDAMYSEVATGVVVNEQDELMELIDEIEMLESMIIEMEAQKTQPQRQPTSLSRIIQKSMNTSSNPDLMIQRLHKRLVAMKADAVNKAMQLNLMHPESPRMPQHQNQEGSAGDKGLMDDMSPHETNHSTTKAPRFQSGKDFIRQTYPDIIHKPKTKMFRSTNQTGSPCPISSRSPAEIDEICETVPSPASPNQPPHHFDMEVERRLRSSVRYAQKRVEKRLSPSLPPPNRGPQRGWKRTSQSPGFDERATLHTSSPMPSVPTPPPTLQERRRHCAGFFDVRNINTKDANSWLARDRNRGEIAWISGLRQYEPLNI